MNVHHRRAHTYAGHQGFETALEFAVEMRDVRRCPAHVEADQLVETRGRRGSYHAYNAAGRTGKNRVLALEQAGIRQTAIRLHEHQLRPGVLINAQFTGDLVNVTSQYRGQVGVDDRRIAARDQLDEWAGFVTE